MTLCDGIPETSAAPNAKLCVCVIFAANDTQHTTHTHTHREKRDGDLLRCCLRAVGGAAASGSFIRDPATTSVISSIVLVRARAHFEFTTAAAALPRLF